MQSCSSLDPHGSRHAGVCAILIVSVACRMAADEPKPDEQINPFPRHVNRTDRLTQWAFADGTAGWTALHDCTLAAKDGKLVITSTGEDPYLHIPVRAPGGEMLLKLRARFGTASSSTPRQRAPTGRSGRASASASSTTASGTTPTCGWWSRAR